MGHIRNYSIGDVVARFQRMNGKSVLYPMGWDAFGLPAENAAIAHGTPPAEWTWENIDYMRDQMTRMGFSYDWNREIATCSPDYYKWTQWIFLKLHERGLAYKKESAVNWCPACQTVLANEQVVQDACERCDTSVTLRTLDQWFFRITDYAEKLLENLDELHGWPEKVKTMQEHWIGRSEGVQISFKIKDSEHRLDVFTTRPDTLYGVTYMVMAPELPLVTELIKDVPNEDEIKKFISRIKSEDESSRVDEEREKEGVFTGRYAIHPLNGEEIPIYLGDYVLASYGTGSIMAVPAHDERDLQFARKYDIPVRVVIRGDEALDGSTMTEPYTEIGTMINSGPFNGLTSDEAWGKIAGKLEEMGVGERTTQYRLRDWLISRQRYWGVPIPMISCDTCGLVPVPEGDLPVILPDDVAFKPTGRSPLVELDDFVNAACPRCGGDARRETDTMDTFVDSSWYFLRYVDPTNGDAPFSKDKADRWMPVDQYIGGVEHAILHLLYSRFITMALYDMDVISFKEPFKNLLTQGMVLKDSVKMSKSRGNVVDPEDMVNQYGADTARLFSLFAAPPERDLEWSDQGVEGSYRFLNRLHRFVTAFAESGMNAQTSGSTRTEAGRELRRITHRTIRRVTDDIAERFHFNTAISAVMELVNAMYAHRDMPQNDQDADALVEATHTAVILMAPFAPFLADELWTVLGHDQSIHTEKWPEVDEEAVTTEEQQIVVQVNGRVRERLNVAVDIDEEFLKEQTLALPKIMEETDGKQIHRVIVVPGRLVNIVAK